MVVTVIAATMKNGVVDTFMLEAADGLPVWLDVAPLLLPPDREAVEPPETPPELAPELAPALLVAPADGTLVGAPYNCAEEKVWQLEEDNGLGVYGGEGTTPSGGWNQVVVAPLVVYTPGGDISSESQTVKVPLMSL
jgi:hypothetical protein